MFFKLFSNRVDSEHLWLSELRDAVESWYNELTEPLMPVLKQNITGFAKLDRDRFSDIAGKLYEQKVLVNSGDTVRNLKIEMGNRGIPFITERDKLWNLIEQYLQHGVFVKSIAYDFASENIEDCVAAQRSAIVGWEDFKQSKDSLVNHISNQLRSIGTKK